MQAMEYISLACKTSRCKLHRYALSRYWQQGQGIVAFVGLNPSTADGIDDDATIRRCVDFAQRWGFAGMDMVNLFSYRATKPTLLLTALQPIGPRNDFWLHKVIKRSDIAVACWGNRGVYLNRADVIRKRYPTLQYLKITAANQPAHPLYLRNELRPKQF